jgi:glycosyltransferase involved in cell wall biosynthesis
MKILIIHNQYLEKGGEDEVVNAEIGMLEKFGHKIIFYKRSNEEITALSFYKKLRFLTKDIIWSKRTYKDLKDIIKKEQPDIAHIHNIFVIITPSVYCALNAGNIPVVQTLHNYRLICPNGVFYRDGRICEQCTAGNFAPSIIYKCWRDSYFLSYFLARALRTHFKKKTFKNRIDCYITLSEFSKKKFIKAGFSEKKLFIKPNFLELNTEKRNEPQNLALFIGRLVDYKGINTLISAFKKIDMRYVKIIGDGPLYKELKRKTKDIVNIELLGRLPHEKTVEYVRNSSFLVFPSECYEPFGRVIIEAFACGVPVLASRLGAAAQIIEDGRTGLHFRSGDPGDLATKAEWAWTHKKEMEEMGREARREYERKYTEDKNYEILMDIYKHAVERAKIKNNY